MALMTDAKEMYIPDSRYRRLEYIHFNGAEAVNAWVQIPAGTGYKVVNMTARYTELNSWVGNGYFDNSSNNTLLWGLSGGNNNGYTQYGVGSCWTYADSDHIAVPLNSWCKWLIWANNGYTALKLSDENDTEIGTTNSRSFTFPTGSGRIYIGAFNHAGTLEGYSKEDVKLVTIRTETSLHKIFEGVPCQRKSDGVCGLYDTITGTFRAMEGTAITDAAAGPIVEENMLVPVKKIEDANNTVLWEPLTLYEDYYLTSYSSTKNSNYIDLGIKWNSKYKVEGAFMIPVPSSEQNYGRMFGTGWNTANEIQLDYQGSGYNLRVLVGNQFSRNATGTSTINTKYQFAYGDRGASKSALWVKTPSQDWARQGAEWDTGDKTSSYNIGVFTCTQGDRDGKYSINYLQINGPESLWNPDDAIMYLVPAKRGDTYGLYDKNHSKFYPGIVANDGQFKITDVNGNQIA